MDKYIAISVKNISFAYDTKPVLKNLSLDIKKGSFVCLTGESGCGKSTLIRLINGLLLPQEGSIEINQNTLNPQNVITIRKDMGYILQGNSLFPHLTVFQNMKFCLDLQKIDAETSKKYIDELLPIVHLPKHILNKFPNELSGGQKQRVGIIRGIAHKPKIILMDEPFSALDSNTRSDLQYLVKSIHNQTKTTFVMVTHSLPEAEKLGTSIFKM